MLQTDGWKPDAWSIASLVKFRLDGWTDGKKLFSHTLPTGEDT